MAKMLWAVQVGLVAAWLMVNGMSSLSTEDALTVGKNLYAPDPPPYPIESFNTLSTNPRQTYLDLIRRIRRLLTDDTLDPVFDIPRLVSRESVPNSRRFLLVELINSNEDTITVAIDTTRIYVLGYRRRNETTQTYEFRYFSDAEDVDALFPDSEPIILPFGGSYPALAQAGGSRSNTPLGLASLELAISDLQADNKPDLARALTVIIQMISEAIRFRYIEDFLGNLIRRQVVQVPDQTMLDLENGWGTLADRIQRSVDGTLDPPVVLTNREGIQNFVSTVTRGLSNTIGILFFVCNRPPNNYQLSLISTGGGTNCTNISEPIIRLPIEKGSGQMEAAGDTCKNIGEPTIRIIGRNGLCADVKDGFYVNGNSIILWPCKSNEDVNQLWTLKADGTIRSNGMCLTTYGYAPGHYIMIFDCRTAVPDATKWEIWDNGTLVNPRASLVLSATLGSAHTTLTMQQNLYASSQAWVVSNNTQLPVIPIMNNVGDMCLEAPDYNPRIIYRGCQSGERRQSFAVYPDGTIRPDRRRDDCLTVGEPGILGLVALVCNGGAQQRWSFNRDYTISTLDTGLAIEARNNAILVLPREARESQMWSGYWTCHRSTKQRYIGLTS